MSDFILDLRRREERTASAHASMIRYFDDIRVENFEFEKFTLVLGGSDDWNVWGPFQEVGGKIFIALCGRIAMDESDWERAKGIGSEGGLACRHVYGLYLAGGVNALNCLNGNYVVVLFDGNIGKMHIVTDRCGMYPCFGPDGADKGFAISSHPDVLARVLGKESRLDRTSFTEFLVTGKVSFPYSYYEHVKSLDYGSIYTFDLNAEQPKAEAKEKYFDFEYRIDNSDNEDVLAEELADAFKKAVKRRSLPRLGKSAIALSGGMDSRTLLCSAENPRDILAFCFFDGENLEYEIARSIATKLGVEFIPLKRNPEYYGNNAEIGVRIYGGMGSINNNHFVGFRRKFHELGINNIITGFYCDYFFKALALDRRVNKYFRFEKPANYKPEWYQHHHWGEGKRVNDVRSRMDGIFTKEIREDQSDLGELRIESLRIFPLCYEPDNSETTVSQKVLPWYLPIVDNDVMDVYLKIPPRYKFNKSLFSKVVKIQCGDEISKIPISNTGATVDASKILSLAHQYRLILGRKIATKVKKAVKTEGSWPNWENYLHQSKVISNLWERDRKNAREFFMDLTGVDPFKKKTSDYKGKDVSYFYRLLTMKIWFDLNIGIQKT